MTEVLTRKSRRTRNKLADCRTGIIIIHGIVIPIFGNFLYFACLYTGLISPGGGDRKLLVIKLDGRKTGDKFSSLNSLNSN